MKIFTLGIAIFALGLANVAYSGDAAAGKEKSATCVACHGADGIATQPLTPNLKGQQEDYFVVAATAYREGTRSNDLMKMFAMSLTDTDIENLAAYYSGL